MGDYGEESRGHSRAGSRVVTTAWKPGRPLPASRHSSVNDWPAERASGSRAWLPGLVPPGEQGGSLSGSQYSIPTVAGSQATDDSSVAVQEESPPQSSQVLGDVDPEWAPRAPLFPRLSISGAPLKLIDAIWTGAQAEVMSFLHHPFLGAVLTHNVPTELLTQYLNEEAFLFSAATMLSQHPLVSAALLNVPNFINTLRVVLYDLHSGAAEAMWSFLQQKSSSNYNVDALVAWVAILRVRSLVEAVIGRRIPTQGIGKSPFVVWISTYGEEAFQVCATLLEEALESCYPQSPDQGEMQRLLDIFRTTIRLDIEIFSNLYSSVPNYTEYKIEQNSPWNPCNLLFATDYDCTCTVKDSCYLLVWASEAAGRINDGRLVQAHQAICTDHDVSVLDCLASMPDFNFDPGPEQFISEIRFELLPGMDPSLESMARAILDQDYMDTEDIPAMQPVAGFAAIREALLWLAQLETDTNKKVMDRGLLVGLTRQAIKAAGKKAAMQNNCLQVLKRLTKSGCSIHVISANWSRDLILSGLSFIPEGMLYVHSNDLEYEASGTSNGKFSSSVTNAFDKEHVLEVLRRIVNQFAGVEQPSSHFLPDDQGRMVVYLGDAQTDLLALLDADLGIVIGKNPALRHMLSKYRIRLLPLVEASAHISVSRLYSSHRSYRQSGILFEASGWEDVEACLFGDCTLQATDDFKAFCCPPGQRGVLHRERTGQQNMLSQFRNSVLQTNVFGSDISSPALQRMPKYRNSQEFTYGDQPFGQEPRRFSSDEGLHMTGQGGNGQGGEFGSFSHGSPMGGQVEFSLGAQSKSLMPFPTHEGSAEGGQSGSFSQGSLIGGQGGFPLRGQPKSLMPFPRQEGSGQLGSFSQGTRFPGYNVYSGSLSQGTLFSGHEGYGEGGQSRSSSQGTPFSGHAGYVEGGSLTQGMPFPGHAGYGEGAQSGSFSHGMAFPRHVGQDEGGRTASFSQEMSFPRQEGQDASFSSEFPFPGEVGQDEGGRTASFSQGMPFPRQEGQGASFSSEFPFPKQGAYGDGGRGGPFSDGFPFLEQTGYDNEGQGGSSSQGIMPFGAQGADGLDGPTGSFSTRVPVVEEGDLDQRGGSLSQGMPPFSGFEGPRSSRRLPFSPRFSFTIGSQGTPVAKKQSFSQAPALAPMPKNMWMSADLQPGGNQGDVRLETVKRDLSFTDTSMGPPFPSLGAPDGSVSQSGRMSTSPKTSTSTPPKPSFGQGEWSRDRTPPKGRPLTPTLLPFHQGAQGLEMKGTDFPRMGSPPTLSNSKDPFEGFDMSRRGSPPQSMPFTSQTNPGNLDDGFPSFPRMSTPPKTRQSSSGPPGLGDGELRGISFSQAFHDDGSPSFPRMGTPPRTRQSSQGLPGVGDGVVGGIRLKGSYSQLPLRVSQTESPTALPFSPPPPLKAMNRPLKAMPLAMMPMPQNTTGSTPNPLGGFPQGFQGEDE